MSLKVRIGFGLGAQRDIDGPRLGALAEDLERLGYDSLWCSERAASPAPDPLLALSFAAARTRRLKLGTSVQVLPGRNPVLLAKEWATLDVLSGGRALPAFGLGIAETGEQQAFGVRREDRGPWLDEALPLLRRLWAEETVDHDGPRFSFTGVQVAPKPTQRLEVWLGGRAPSELRRVARLADGWLASFTSPADCAAGRASIEEQAGALGRTVDPEHFGAMVFYAHGELPDAVREVLRARTRGAPPDDVVAIGWAGVRERCEAYVEAGFSKLVLVPFATPADWGEELAAGAEAVLDLQTPSRAPA